MMTSTKNSNLRLEVFQAMWSMERRAPDGIELPLEERFKKVKEAGFDGIGLDFATDVPHEIAECEAAGPLFKEYELGCMITAFPNSIADLLPYLKMAQAYGARFVTVVGMVMPLTVAGMVPVVRAWIQMAADHGVELHFETHRNCLTNDLHPTLQLLDAVPEMTMVGDLSHVMVGREFTYPITPRDAQHMRRLMERCEHFQGRVASREQVQVQLGFPQHAKWVRLFEAWWREGFELWHQRHQHATSPVTMQFMCELGPPDYAITDQDGWELSDRWQEALQLKDTAQSIFQELDEK